MKIFIYANADNYYNFNYHGILFITFYIPVLFIDLLSRSVLAQRHGHMEVQAYDSSFPPSKMKTLSRDKSYRLTLEIWAFDSNSSEYPEEEEPRKFIELSESLPNSKIESEWNAANFWISGPFNATCSIYDDADTEISRDSLANVEWSISSPIMMLNFPRGCRWGIQIKTVCDENWYNKLCDLHCMENDPITKCTENGEKVCNDGVCLNGGACNGLVDGGPMCNCSSAFHGERCQSKANECQEAKLCKNGADCVSVNDTYVCLCLRYFQGPQCEKRKSCATNPCDNGGRCFDSQEGFVCNCTKPFFGSRCSINASLLATNMKKTPTISKWPSIMSLAFAIGVSLFVAGVLVAIPIIWLYTKSDVKEEKIKSFKIKLKPDRSDSSANKPRPLESSESSDNS